VVVVQRKTVDQPLYLSIYLIETAGKFLDSTDFRITGHIESPHTPAESG
jgi:hypothetical protein